MTVEIRAPGADMTPLSTAIQNIQIYIVDNFPIFVTTCSPRFP